MPTLPAVIVTLLLPFERLFDPRTWRKAQLLAMGAILSPGKRTVSSALNRFRLLVRDGYDTIPRTCLQPGDLLCQSVTLPTGRCTAMIV